MDQHILTSFPTGYRVLILGASGGIGAAFAEQLSAQPACGAVHVLHRHSEPALDFADEASIAAAAASMRAHGPFHLIINAAGLLHSTDFMPEKKLSDLHYAQLMATFQVNTFGPALVLRHFSGLLDTQRAVLVMLSAKVGSIEDNRLGGWYSYRASKAALNMLIKTAAIELKRSQPATVLLAMHPGTVTTRLSQPFRGGSAARPARQAVQEMLAVIDQKMPADSGSFVTYSNENLPW